MAKMIFVNLPVADVEASAAFYAAVGFTRDDRFSQPGQTASMQWSDSIVFMLLSHDHFGNFTTRTIVDAKTSAQVLICLSQDSAAATDALVDRAVAAGGTADPSPRQEMGDFMYGRSFEDFDGHIIEVMWMDVDKAMAAWDPEAQPA